MEIVEHTGQKLGYNASCIHLDKIMGAGIHMQRYRLDGGTEQQFWVVINGLIWNYDPGLAWNLFAKLQQEDCCGCADHDSGIV